MRLVHGEYELSFDLKENIVNVLVVENATVMAELLEELYLQTLGKEGRFVLSSEDKEYALDKNMMLILNPFALSFSEKKIQNKIYKDISELALENYIEERFQLQAIICQYLGKLLELLPYSLDYSDTLDVNALCHIFDVKIDIETNSLIEKLVEYIRVVSEILKYRVVVLVNIKSFLTEEEIMQLYEFCFYEKVHLILIENMQRNFLEKTRENYIIIDKDRCIMKI